ncbi:MAG: HEPN domain-containing protein [Chloroflexi bacterium]|nr:HEPN domain-containing protein [Chloroflexota bacterium]
MKAFLYRHGEREVLGHSVAGLCKRAAAVRKEFSALTQKARRLDRFYIPTRYPNGLPEGIPAESYDKADAQSALDLAREIYDAVKKQLDV